MDRCDDNISRYCTLSHEETIAKIGHLLIVVESVASSSFRMRKQWRAVSLQGHIADHWYCRLWWYNQKMTFGSLFSFSEQLRSHYQNAKIFLGSHSDLNKCRGVQSLPGPPPKAVGPGPPKKAIGPGPPPYLSVVDFHYIFDFRKWNTVLIFFLRPAIRH